jgi:hypothetical protein
MENTNEGNKLIAEFMGSSFDYPHYPYPDDELRFHESWDWLMPVVEKIEEEYEVSILGDECEISTMGYRVSRIVLVQDSNKLNSVYKAMVEFIQWYNRNEK